MCPILRLWLRALVDVPLNLCDGPKARPEHLQQLIDSIAALHKHSYIKSLQATVNHVRLGDISKITAPAHFIVGANDRLTPVAMHHEMAAKLRGAPVSVVPDAGHLNAAALQWLVPRAAVGEVRWPVGSDLSAGG